MFSYADVDIDITDAAKPLHSPTRLAFGVLTFKIENRMGLHAVSGSPDYTPWFPRWSELGSPGGQFCGQKVKKKKVARLSPRGETLFI